jgi:hypothetical protein
MARPEDIFATEFQAGLLGVSAEPEKIENRVNLGTPDQLVGIGDQLVLVELKVVSSGRKVKLRPHQVSFLVRHGRRGRPCWIFVKVIQGERYLLFHGRDAIDVLDHGIDHPHVAQWQGRVDWGALAGQLTGKI